MVISTPLLVNAIRDRINKRKQMNSLFYILIMNFKV